MSKLPVIIVSSCLLGQNVRYDGRNKYSQTICELKNQFQILPVCPEVGAGLSVPRPAVNLYKIGQNIYAKGSVDRSLDVTKTITDWVKQYLLTMNADGLILKSKSPTCGYNTTPIYESGIYYLSHGLFTQKILEQLPSTPITDENLILDQNKRNLFIENVWSQFNAK